jgi:hypothetical protein
MVDRPKKGNCLFEPINKYQIRVFMGEINTVILVALAKAKELNLTLSFSSISP